MRYQLNLALAFMRKTHGRGLFNAHIHFSILGILVGVAFLIFTLTLYDGYVKKLETMIFGFFPQITIYADPSATEEEEPPKSLFADERQQHQQAGRICNGTLILKEAVQQDKQDKTRNRFDLASLKTVAPVLAANPQVTTYAPVIFEQEQFRVQVEQDGHPHLLEESLRVLGVGHSGNEFVPQIDRLVSEPALLSPLRDPTRKAILIAVELYRTLYAEEPPAGPLQRRLLLDQQPKQPPETYQVNPSRYIELEVVGVFRFGMHKIAENMMITSFSVAQTLCSMQDTATFLGVSLDEAYSAETEAHAIKYSLPGEGYLVFHWLSMAGDMFQNLTLYRRIILLVLLMSIVITTFNIHNTLTIMIFERKRHIGILLSMGLRKWAIYGVFIWISVIEAVLGCLGGLITGIAAGRYFSGYLDRELAEFLPITGASIEVHTPTILLICLIVVLLCGITSLRSARAAAALNPVRCLQAE